MNQTTLQLALRRAHRRIESVGLAAVLCEQLSLLALLVWVAVLFDAAWPLSAAELAMVDALLLFGAIVAAWRVVCYVQAHRYEPRRVARCVEQRLGIPDSRYINAVEMAADPAAYGPLGQAVVQRGVEAVAQVDGRELADRRPLRVQTLRLLAVAAFTLLACVFVPNLPGMVLPRLLHPASDLPPFTFLRFDVATEPQPIHRGKPAAVRVAITGPSLPETADLVFTDDPERPSAPMLRQSAGTFVLSLERAEATRTFYIQTPHGRSREHRLTILPVPLFESVSVRYDYPSYTGWPSVERPLSAAGLQAIAGTKATLRIKSNIELGEGGYTFQPEGQETPAPRITLVKSPDDPAVVTGTVLLTTPGRFALDLLASGGEPSQEPLTGRVAVSADAPPALRLRAPDRRIVAPEGWKVPVQISAVDDVGVHSASLRLTHNGTDAGEIPLELDRPRPTYAGASTQINLQSLGAKAGDVVKGYGVAQDNHPDAPRSTESPAFEIRIVSAEQYEHLLRKQEAGQDLSADLEAMGAAGSTLVGPNGGASSLKPDNPSQAQAGSDTDVAEGERASDASNKPERWETAPAANPAEASDGSYGVPLQYRQRVEQYFRRLAEDSR